MIFIDDVDRHCWNFLLGETCRIFRFTIYSYCQMGNHFHLLVRTNEGKLARGMRFLNGEYSRQFNLRHSHVGHLFQGRYTAIVCEDERYQHELVRYILLNPVRACLVRRPEEWAWSSIHATMGSEPAPTWLDVGAVLGPFGSQPRHARAQFYQYVLQGIGSRSPLADVKHQAILGDPEAVRLLRGQNDQGSIEDLSYAHRKLLVKPLEAFFPPGCDRSKAMADAYASLGYTMGEIARFCGVTTRTVSRAVKKHKGAKAD